MISSGAWRVWGREVVGVVGGEEVRGSGCVKGAE